MYDHDQYIHIWMNSQWGLWGQNLFCKQGACRQVNAFFDLPWGLPRHLPWGLSRHLPSRTPKTLAMRTPETPVLSGLPSHPQPHGGTETPVLAFVFTEQPNMMQPRFKPGTWSDALLSPCKAKDVDIWELFPQILSTWPVQSIHKYLQYHSMPYTGTE
jgi:hypothetical protein